MKTNLQSPRPGHIVNDTIYFERHIQNKNQEVKNEYAQALSKILEAEKSILQFAKVFNDR
jgi:hypothetical protein